MRSSLKWRRMRGCNAYGDRVVAAANAAYVRHEEELKYASMGVDITADPVGYGVLRVEDS